jgi:DNA-binding NarL/FixJ family response regulator
MRTIICDDQAIIRDGLELLLRLERDIEVVAKARDGAEAVDLVAQHQPDLVLMDLKMPDVNGVEATRRIRARFPHVKVLVLTTFDDDEWLFDALRAGAAGYILKDTPREDVVKAVRGTAAGKTFIDPAVAGRVLDRVAGVAHEPGTLITERLSERETDVLRLLAGGLSNRDIAHRLHLSEGTVRNHVSVIFAKLEVTDRTQAAIIAIRHGLANR